MLEVLDFWASWCGPCLVMNPIIDQLEKEFFSKVKITKINVDEDPQTASKYAVFSIPTYIVLKEGKEVDRVVGAISKEKLKSKIEDKLP